MSDSFQEAFRSELRYLQWFPLIASVERTPPMEMVLNLTLAMIHAHAGDDSDLENLANTPPRELTSSPLSCQISYNNALLPGDPTDEFGKKVRSEFPGTRIICKFARVENEYGRPEDVFCAIVFPHSVEMPRYRRLDHEEISFRDVEVLHWGAEIEPGFGHKTDIRALIGNRGYKRVLTVAAGAGRDSDNSAQSLMAVQNDFRALLGLLTRFGIRGELPGVTATGLVTTTKAFWRLLKFQPNRRLAGVIPGAVLPSDLAFTQGFDGNLIRDSALPTSGDGGPTFINTSIQNSTVGCLELDEYDALISDTYPAPVGKKPQKYVLISYAGHGGPEAELKLDQEELITADELFSISRKTNTPFVFLLDMCHAHSFGRRYQILMKKYNMPGLVICATNHDDGSWYAQESSEMRYIRRPGYPFQVQNNTSESRGIFSTAFCLALMQLRDLDRFNGYDVPVTVDRFVTQLLTPMCTALARIANTEPQVPSVYAI